MLTIRDEIAKDKSIRRKVEKIIKAQGMMKFTRCMDDIMKLRTKEYYA